MAETYCGKNCSECAEYQNSLCPGCRQGPGSWLGNDCDIAQCARIRAAPPAWAVIRKRLAFCAPGASVMPERRKQRAAAKEAGQALRRQRKDVGKWLWIYFWMPDTLADCFLYDQQYHCAGAARAEIPGEILGILVGIAECVLLFLLSKEEQNYGYAAWAMVPVIVISVPDVIYHAGYFKTSPSLTHILAIMSLLAAASTAVMSYFECKANRNVLTDVDARLSEKWRKLWGQYRIAWILLWIAWTLLYASEALALIRITAVKVFRGHGAGCRKHRFDRRGHPAAHLSVQNGQTFPGAVNICRSRGLAAAFSVSYRCTFGPNMV